MHGGWTLLLDAMVPRPSGGGNGAPPWRPHPPVLAPRRRPS